MPERHQLNIDGRLVGAVELAGDHSWTTVRRDDVLVFRDKGEYQLVVIARTERHDERGELVHAGARVVTDSARNAHELEELVRRRWPATSDAWWTMLEDGPGDLYAAWVPEQMRRDLLASSIYDRDLALSPSQPVRLEPENSDWRRVSSVDEVSAGIARVAVDHPQERGPGPGLELA